MATDLIEHMNEQVVELSVAGELAAARDVYARAVRRATTALATEALSDRELIATLKLGGQHARLSDALLVAAIEQVHERNTAPRDERLTTRLGAKDAAELVRAATLCSGKAARTLMGAAKVTGRERCLTTGQLLPGRFPHLAAALREGAISAATFLAATRPLTEAAARISTDDLAEADQILAAYACGHGNNATVGDGVGEDTDAGVDADCPGADAALPPLDADDLAALARRITAYADPDGAEPTEKRALARRGLTLGKPKDGLVPINGHLMPETASQLECLLSAIINPRSTKGDVNFDQEAAAVSDVTATSEAAAGCDDRALSDSADNDGRDCHGLDGHGFDGHDFDGHDSGTCDGTQTEQLPPPDERTSPQKRHDALAAILNLAAGAADAPTLGGAPPTLVVTISAEDFESQSGWAHLDGLDVRTSWHAAQRIACVGVIQRVIHLATGRIVGIHTTGRVFNAAQRRAIIARDRECVIPGCHTPAAWCEIHHVHDWALGGKTHTDNGVLLCWFHHRTLGYNGWHIRMTDGLPQVRGPQWWDPHRRWHQVHTTLARAG
ncbi:HNH endonuclease signature motif containing protein [Epidermidibacterium keratini]